MKTELYDCIERGPKGYTYKRTPQTLDTRITLDYYTLTLNMSKGGGLYFKSPSTSSVEHGRLPH
jgi:hypothetical protein